MKNTRNAKRKPAAETIARMADEGKVCCNFSPTADEWCRQYSA